jgi:peptidoglycan hydrolase CwlO-like protein
MTTQEERKIKLERTADKATKWIGSTTSLIVHTILFIFSFVVPFTKLITFEQMLLILTTLVSLEAIYLAIFIQMSVNKNSQDIEIIQEDVGEIQEDIEDIQEDIGEIEKDVDEIQEDIEDIEEETSDDTIEKKEADALAAIQSILLKLQEEIEVLKRK